MRKIPVMLLGLALMADPINNDHYERNVADRWNNFAKQAIIWVQLHKSFRPAAGRAPMERAQWEVVKKKFEELQRMVDSQ